MQMSTAFTRPGSAVPTGRAGLGALVFPSVLRECRRQHLERAVVAMGSVHVTALELLVDVQLQIGATLVLVTHDPGIADYADRRIELARADSVRRAVAARRNRREPPARIEEGPLKTKPPLSDKLVIRLGEALKPGAKYAVEFKGLRSVSGIPGRMILGFQVPEEKPPPDSTKAKGDSTKAKGDSTKAKGDTTKTPRKVPQ